MANHHDLLATDVVHGSPHGDTLTIRPGDTAVTGPGNDTVTISPLLGTGGSVDRAFVFAGPGNDTIINEAIPREPGGAFPVTAIGGPGNDTFISLSSGDNLFTGGPGHDVFHFSTLPFHGGGATITDFSRQDALVIDVDSGFPPTITFTNNGTSTTVDAVAAGASVHVELQGTFDSSLFHVASDGAGHDVITYGNGAGDMLLV